MKSTIEQDNQSQEKHLIQSEYPISGRILQAENMSVFESYQRIYDQNACCFRYDYIRFEDMNSGDLIHQGNKAAEGKSKDQYNPQVRPSESGEKEKNEKQQGSPLEHHRPEHKLVSKKSLHYKNSFQRLNSSGAMNRPILKVASNEKDKGMTDKLHHLMASYLSKEVSEIQKSIVNHVEYTLARTRFDFKQTHCYQAVAHSVRDRLIESFNDTHRAFNLANSKKVYYLSLQFLIGRCLQNALNNLNIEEEYKQALRDLGYTLESIYEKEVDAALGNGGLGRLAACFLDSMATLNYPAWGYGIRYDYGIFKQIIQNGYQCQVPDFWLSNGNPWQIERIDVNYKVNFYGHVRKAVDSKGVQRSYWQNCQTIVARAYDTPIPGYATFNTIALRLWKSLPLNEFDFYAFNQGAYTNALEARQRAEYITSVLYPNDSTEAGKELRLKQQYLLVCATLQDIIRRHKCHAKEANRKFQWADFAKEVSIQLNDTHPALGIVQLLRILIDQEHFSQQKAWQIIYDTFSYTNHTVLPEALEKWSVELLGKLLPRHLELIYLINFFWMNKVSKRYPHDNHKMNVLSLVEESIPKKIRMANLCIIGSHKVNGVAALHSELLKTNLFKDFHEFFPTKFVNVTNGITTRRWIACCNPLLADLYTEYLKTDEWIMDMSRLRQLQKYADDEDFQSKWRAIKLNNKRTLTEWIYHNCKVSVNENSMFDIQIKRIHEYKRQFMNILYVIYRYLTIKEMTPEQRKNVVPRTVMFSGKAAPAYFTAKNIIKLINQVATVVNNDSDTRSLLKVVFLPNYCVSNAEKIIPASELSQHISTAGTEASGTSNMKFVMNGGLILGTMDGANVEIHDQVGSENIFIFGARVDAIDGLRHIMSTLSPEEYIPAELKKVINSIRAGTFGQKDLLMQLVSTITNNNDVYLVTADFQAYIEAQKVVDQTYLDKKKWTRMSILNALRTGHFSSDRTIEEYAKNIWNLKKLKVDPLKQVI